MCIRLHVYTLVCVRSCVCVCVCVYTCVHTRVYTSHTHRCSSPTLAAPSSASPAPPTSHPKSCTAPQPLKPKPISSSTTTPYCPYPHSYDSITSSPTTSATWASDPRSPVAQLVNFIIDDDGFEPQPHVTYLTRADLKQFLSHGIRDVNRVTLLQVWDLGFRV